MLWMLPTGFLVICVGGLFALSNNIFIGGNTVIAASVVLNALFVIGSGWCDYKLSPPERKTYRSAGMAICLFFLSQIFLVPIVLGVGAFALCSFSR